MEEKTDPPEFMGGKYPANDPRASKGLALAEFIDAAGASSVDDAAVQGSLRSDDVGPIPPARLARQFDIVLLEHPFALAAGCAIAGFALGIVAASVARTRPNSRNDSALALESQQEILEIERDVPPRGGI